MDLVAPRGVIVLKTTVAGRIEVDLAPLVVNEVRLIGSRCGDIARAIDVLARGAVDPMPLVEASYPLSRADEAFAHASRRGARKVLVQNDR
jgi:threonine dehydrogenase-like Zn-dependent dehydrogenase